MKNILKTTLFVGMLLSILVSCEQKSPFPEISNGANFVALPDPLPAAVTAANVNTITVTLANVTSANLAFTTKSVNAEEIGGIEAFIESRER